MKSKLARQNERLNTLYSIALDLLHQHKMEDVLNTILLRASELLTSPIGFLDLVDGQDLIIYAATEPVKSYCGMRMPIKSTPLTALAIETNQPQMVNNYVKRRNRVRAFDPLQVAAACTFPIVVNGKVVGALSLGRNESNKPFISEDVEAMRSLAELAAIAIQKANVFEETYKQSITDGLTGLANRRYFDILLNREWEKARQEFSSLALIMLDIDSFKLYNDSYGHVKGDECLIKIADVLNRSIRKDEDILARYGGEEFSVIMPNINLINAKKRAQSLRASVKSLKIPHGSGFVTISLGVSVLKPSLHNDVNLLVSLADQALYQAKRRGKNRVVTIKSPKLGV